MARRVNFRDSDAVIQSVKEDGGVILTNFSSTEDVKKVNADAAPYIQKIIQDVCSLVPYLVSYLFAFFGGGGLVSKTETTPNSAHCNLSPEKRLDATVCSDAVGLHEKNGFSSLHFLK